MTNCGRCGNEIPPPGKFCQTCGAAQELPPVASTQPPADPVSLGAKVARTVLVAAGWIFSYVAALLALISLFQGQMWLAGTAALLAISLSPKVPVPAPFRPKAIVAGLVLLSIATGVEGWKARQANRAGEAAIESAAAEDEAQARAFRAEFAVVRDSVINVMREAIASGDNVLALRTGAQYRETGDVDLEHLMNEALSLKAVADQRAREAELVAEARGIPASAHEANLRVYQELAEIAPENARYVERAEYYGGLVLAKRAADRERAEWLGPRPEPSAWDGTYRVVRDYLRNIANDPGSIEMDACTQVYTTDDGWLVGCDYRGKNAFGALIRQSNWFTIRQGGVVKMEAATAYRR